MRPHSMRCFAVCWLSIESAGIIAQRRMYAYHFVTLVPPAALLFGMMRRRKRPGRDLRALLPAAVLAFGRRVGRAA